MSLIRNFSEYEIICEALNALENVANQENRQPGGSLYNILSEAVRNYDSGLTAEDLFNALDYTKSIQNNFKSLIFYSNSNEWHAVVFYLDTHEVKLINNEDTYVTISKELHKAIMKQIEELGWLELVWNN